MHIDILMYADDIIILASSPKDAQIMLNEVTKFGKDYQIKFNPDKTNVLIYNAKPEDELVVLLLCNAPIVRTKCVKYLGVQLSDDYKNQEHLNKRKTAVQTSYANLISTGVINDQMDIYTKMCMFKIYLKPLLFYGCEVLDLSPQEVNELKRIEGNMIKKIIGMAKQCKSTSLYGALEIETVEDSIKKLQYKFIKRAQKSNYVNQFLIESSLIKNNNSLIGKIINNLNLDTNANITTINTNIEKDIIRINSEVADKSKYSEEVNTVKEIL